METTLTSTLLLLVSSKGNHTLATFTTFLCFKFAVVYGFGSTRTFYTKQRLTSTNKSITPDKTNYTTEKKYNILYIDSVS